MCAHHHSGNAVTALRGLFLDEGALHRPGLVEGAEALDGAHTARAHGRDRRDARENRFAVQHHRARAALPEPATELGAVQPQVVPQHVEQRRIGIGVDVLHLSVHVERDHSPPLEILRTSARTSCHGGRPESERR